MTGDNTLERETQTVVEQLAEAACLELFTAYHVAVTREDAAAPGLAESTLTGIVGFTGAGLTGMVLMASTESPLRASNPASGSLRDWVAELTNQLAGRLKHKLIAEGIEVYITTPIVLRATRIEPLPRRELAARVLRGAGGTISLWCEVEVSADFKLNVPGQIAVAEGEALLF
jgi:CheY-specific phosphatase CheX